MTEGMIPGQPCANCDQRMYVRKAYEAKFGEANGRDIATSKRFTHVYWLCANCGKNPRELWMKEQQPRLEEKANG